MLVDMNHVLIKLIIGPLKKYIGICVVGAVSGCGRRTREDDRGGACVQHPPGCQLPGVSAEEELAERARPLRQEHHGQTTAPLLNDGFSVNKKNGASPKLMVLGFLFSSDLS